MIKKEKKAKEKKTKSEKKSKTEKGNETECTKKPSGATIRLYLAVCGDPQAIDLFMKKVSL